MSPADEGIASRPRCEWHYVPEPGCANCLVAVRALRGACGVHLMSEPGCANCNVAASICSQLASEGWGGAGVAEVPVAGVGLACGASINGGKNTTRPGEVTCSACVAELESRAKPGSLRGVNADNPGWASRDYSAAFLDPPPRRDAPAGWPSARPPPPSPFERAYRFALTVNGVRVPATALRWEGGALVLTCGMRRGQPPLYAGLIDGADVRVVLFTEGGARVRVWRLSYERIQDRGFEWLDAERDEVVREAVAFVGATLVPVPVPRE